MLRCRVTLRDGRTVAGELPVERHRALQLWMLHRETRGLVELTPGTRDLDGRLHVDRRSRPEHYLVGGAGGDKQWLAMLLEHAAAIVTARTPGCASTTGRARRCSSACPSEANREAPRTRSPRLAGCGPTSTAPIASMNCGVPGRAAVSAARRIRGIRRVHAYWHLDPALLTKEGEREPIERANLRIIHALGDDVADANCKERSRVLSLPGTVNFKTGNHARTIEGNLMLAPYDAGRLVGDLPDPPQAAAVEAAIQRREGRGEDPYKRVPAPKYFPLLAGISVPPRGGLVKCPAHEDEHPSCSVSATEPVSKCHACQAGGTIYDLASAVLGGPTGAELGGGIQASPCLRDRGARRGGEAMSLGGVQTGEVVLVI
jgi:hypothetical protein